MPKQERPRERLIKYGKDALSNEELLAIILKTGTKDVNVKNLALMLLKEINDIKNLKDITKEQLVKIKGIGETKAIEILSAIELGKRVYQVSDTKNIKFDNSKDIYEYNRYLYLGNKQECFYVLYLDNKRKLIERKLLFMGTINRSIVHPREIFKNAYLLSASSIVCMHNHPSGDITPSAEDIFLTKNLIEIGRVQAIPLIDHIIFSDNNYYSFSDQGYINNIR